MPNIFLCHASIDKPFVEKLGKDLKRLGVNVWYDKWEIKVGESILWKIEKGIRENEYLGLVFSPEALDSEWVKAEVGAAWSKQMKTRKIVILPILYRNCEIPYFIAERKYANFVEDYTQGMLELSQALGLDPDSTINMENWRKFVRKKDSNWKLFREKEYENLVTVLVDRCNEYNWYVNTNAQNFSITLHCFISSNAKCSISLKLNGRTNAYVCSQKYAYNPRHLKATDFDIYVGNTVNECEEFVWRIIDNFTIKNGKPSKKASHSISKYLNSNQREVLINKLVRELSWYKGDQKL